jgi:hypothetical protein
VTTPGRWSRLTSTAGAAIVTAGAGLVAVLPTNTPASAAPARVAACTPADLSATLILNPVGGSSSSLAGAVIFANTSAKPCGLHAGIPKVKVVGPTGAAIAAPEVPAITHHARPVTLPASGSTSGLPDAGISITWSSWSCPTGSFALDVRFPGWSSPLAVPYGSTTGYAGTPCDGGDAALFVSPVARAQAPA